MAEIRVNTSCWGGGTSPNTASAQGRGMEDRGRLRHFEEEADFMMPRHTRSPGPVATNGSRASQTPGDIRHTHPSQPSLASLK